MVKTGGTDGWCQVIYFTMAVNAIVIVENSKQISLKEFAHGLKTDPWGKEDERPFYLPLDLDFLVPGWRETAKIEIDDPYMIF